MRIIKHGFLPEYAFTCKRCGCEFIAAGNEYSRSDVYDPVTDKVYLDSVYVNCPECSQYNVKRCKGDK